MEALLVRYILQLYRLTSSVVGFLLSGEVHTTPFADGADAAVGVRPRVAALLFLWGCGIFHALRLSLRGIVLGFLRLGGTGRPAGSRYELHASLLDVHLQGCDELPAVIALDELVAHGQPGTQHILFLLSDFRLSDALRYAHLVCWNVRDFIRLAVYADERGDDFTCFFVHEVHDPAEVASFAQVLTVFVRKLVFLVLVEFLFLADEVRHEADIAFTVFLEREAGIQLESLAAELGRHLHQIGLAVVEHLGQVAGLFKVVTFHAPFLFQLLPVDFVLVDGLVAPSALCLLWAFLILFLFLFHFFLFMLRLFRLFGSLFFLYLLFVAGGVHFVGCEQFLVGFRVFQQVFHHLQQFVGLVCRDTVETEAAGFLALPEEVFEEVVQHVAVAVELQETLRVLRFRGGTLGRAVGIQPGYHADFARLFVTDYQHVLFSCFLCHLKNVLMGYF